MVAFLMSFLKVPLFTLIFNYLLLHLGFCEAYQICLVALIKILTVHYETKTTENFLRKAVAKSSQWILDISISDNQNYFEFSDLFSWFTNFFSAADLFWLAYNSVARELNHCSTYYSAYSLWFVWAGELNRGGVNKEDPNFLFFLFTILNDEWMNQSINTRQKEWQWSFHIFYKINLSKDLETIFIRSFI